MSEWNAKWEKITPTAKYVGRKIAHQNGGDFIDWDVEFVDGKPVVSALVRVTSGHAFRHIMWGPELVKQYIRLIPEREL